MKRIRVTWGGDSLVKCEYILLKAAFLGKYQYYHLISGVDFPIKSQAYIHAFFEKNEGKSFFDITQNKDKTYRYIAERNAEYHLFQNVVGKNRTLINPFYNLERRLIKIQRRLGINRV